MTTVLTKPVRPLRVASRPAVPSAPALVTWVVGAIGVLALWCLVYAFLIGSLQEHDSQRQLFGDLRSQLSLATAPLGPTAYGKPVALLDANAADLHGVVVVEGTGGQDLVKGPGHVRTTVLPGQAGTAVLLGRSALFGGPFRHVPDLRKGDVLRVTTGQGELSFQVERLRRPGDPLPPALSAGQSRLVLGTSEGVGWRAGVAPTSVVYVDALLQGEAKPATGQAAAIALPADERPMAVSTEPLIALVFWLQAFLVLVLAAVWLTARWGRLRTWVVAFPALLAVAIGTSTTASGMLPNLL